MDWKIIYVLIMSFLALLLMICISSTIIYLYIKQTIKIRRKQTQNEKQPILRVNGNYDDEIQYRLDISVN